MYVFANFCKEKKSKDKFKWSCMGGDDNGVEEIRKGSETSEYLYIFIVLITNPIACSKKNLIKKNPKM